MCENILQCNYSYTPFLVRTFGIAPKSATKGLALGYISGKTTKQKPPRQQGDRIIDPINVLSLSLCCLAQASHTFLLLVLLAKYIPCA
jgi:hypothetical protein